MVTWDRYEKDPAIFQQIEVYADGGVRSGGDVLKLLSLGVRAVGVGRPFMYSLLYGTEGVVKAAEILNHELTIDSQNLGLGKLRDINTTFVSHPSFACITMVLNWIDRSRRGLFQLCSMERMSVFRH